MRFITRFIRKWTNNKRDFLILTASLVIGIGSFSVVALWCYAHFQFDKHIKDIDDIYFISISDTKEEESDIVVPHPMGDYVREKVPELSNSAMYTLWGENVKLGYGEISGYEEINEADSQLVSVLSIPFIERVPVLFPTKYHLAISASLAKKYTGSVHAIGKTIMINDSIPFVISGVYHDIPQNRTIRPKLLARFDVEEELSGACSGWNSYCYTLVTKTPQGIQKGDVEQKLTSLFRKDHEKEAQLELFPLADIHLYEPLENHLINQLWLILISGVLVLMVSAANFSSLFTACLIRYYKNIEIQFTLGASRVGIVLSMLLEILLIVIFATGVSVFIGLLLLQVTQSEEIIPLLKTIPVLDLCVLEVGVILLTGLLVSLYPVLFMWIKLLRYGRNKVSEIKVGKMSYAMIISQFALTFFISLVAIFYQKQLNFVLNADKGYDASNVLVIKSWDFPFMKNEKVITHLLKEMPEVTSYSFSELPFTGLGTRTTRFYPATQEENNNEYKVLYRTDGRIAETMKVKMVKGRDFEPNQYNEQHNVIINETYARQLGGVDKALHMQLKSGSHHYTVIGICADFNFENFYNEIEPLVMEINPSICGSLIVRTTPGSGVQVGNALSETLAGLSDAPFQLNPMRDLMKDMYAVERSQKVMLSVFGILTFLVGCLGLFGLSIFVTERKTKEIGIRKVNGARIYEVMVMLNRDFIKWVAIAFIVAAPIAFFSMQQWLQHFAYKTSLSWWVFVAAGLLALGIAILTVSWQSWKAATRNPVDALRYE